MRVIEAADVHRVLNFPELIEALRTGFGGKAGMPRRTLYHLDENDPFHDAFAVLPAWNDTVIGVKAFTYLPSNVPKGLPVLYSKILLFSRATGAPVALVDGTSVTYWRTAAIAGLAADYLARKNAERLLVCGTGNLGSYMILAHAAVRQYREIAVWGRTPAKVANTIATVKAQQPALNCVAVTDLEAAARAADVIACATSAKQPLILGDWIRPGTYVDLFGNHERAQRECDTALIVKSRLFVDSRANTMNEAGEILVPIAEGAITESHVLAELADLCGGRNPGRVSEDEITCFKSVGTALADLVAANLVAVRQ